MTSNITNGLKKTSKESELYYDTYLQWTVIGAKTITLNVTQEDMLKYINDNKYKLAYVLDAGRTQVEPGSLTAIGFYPTDTLTEEMKKFKLL